MREERNLVIIIKKLVEAEVCCSPLPQKPTASPQPQVHLTCGFLQCSSNLSPYFYSYPLMVCFHHSSQSDPFKI